MPFSRHPKPIHLPFLLPCAAPVTIASSLVRIDGEGIGCLSIKVLQVLNMAIPKPIYGLRKTLQEGNLTS